MTRPVEAFIPAEELSEVPEEGRLFHTYATRQLLRRYGIDPDRPYEVRFVAGQDGRWVSQAPDLSLREVVAQRRAEQEAGDVEVRPPLFGGGPTT